MTVADRTDSVLAAGIVDGPGGYTGVAGDAQWAAEIRRLADLRGATILAVPVFDPSRKPTMTIGGASFSAQLDATRIKALASDLGALAERVTRALSGGAATT